MYVENKKEVGEMKVTFKKDVSQEELLELATKLVVLCKDTSSNCAYLGLDEEWLDMVRKNIENDWLETFRDFARPF